jgi:hypothetical protein
VRRDVGAREGDQRVEGPEHDAIERRLLLALFGGGLGLEKGADAGRERRGAGTRWARGPTCRRRLVVQGRLRSALW